LLEDGFTVVRAHPAAGAFVFVFILQAPLDAHELP
jgi:hypothetical protein